MTEKVLNEQQKIFLEVLFTEEVNGNLAKAKKLAGYSDNYATSSIIKTLEKEILEATRSFLLRTGPRAAISLAGVLDNPTEMGVSNKIVVAKDILDRIGIVKTEKVEVNSNGIFILPPKDKE